MSRLKFLIVAPAVATSLIFSGCDDSSPLPEEHAHAAPAATPAAKPAAPAVVDLPAMKAFVDDGNVAELEIEGDDKMKFNKKELELKPGQMVRLTLKHVGKLPAQSMGHNFVLLKQGEVPMEFSADVNENGGSLYNSYVPEPVQGRVIAYTRIIGGGQTATVTFQAPAEAGEYPFLCSFPGHVGMMNGIAKVAP